MSEQASTTTEAQEAAPATEAPAVEAPTEHDEFDATRALDKIRKVNAEAKAMRDRAKAAEDKVATLEDAAKRVPDLEAQLVRERVARKLGLPDALVDRLRGATEDEVLADAESLVALVAPKAKQLRPVEALQPGSGKSDPSTPTQLGLADLKAMAPDAIETARAAGRFNDLLGVK